RSRGRRLFQPGAADRGRTGSGYGLDGGARRLWTPGARVGRGVVGGEGREILQTDGPDLLRAAEPARGLGARDLAYRPALPAMDDAARHGRGAVRVAARGRRFRRSADAETGLGRLSLMRPRRRPGPTFPPLHKLIGGSRLSPRIKSVG